MLFYTALLQAISPMPSQDKEDYTVLPSCMEGLEGGGVASLAYVGPLLQTDQLFVSPFISTENNRCDISSLRYADLKNSGPPACYNLFCWVI
jgi:hypothetical protein